MGNGMNKVLPGLYVGNFRDSKDQDQLAEHNITHILAIHDNARKLPCNSNKEYLCIIASDTPGQNLTQFFSICNDFIHNARLKGGSVLIHCLAGMSRSVTIAVTYVMCVTSLNWRDSLKAVQGARNIANPNVGFLKQLQEYEKEKLQDERRRLKDKFPDTSLVEDDEEMSKTFVASYYHFMSTGEMCDGKCPPGSTCPRGLCHANRSGIFRRSCKENDRRSANSLHASPTSSPTHSRNPSPTPPHRRSQSNASSYPISPNLRDQLLNHHQDNSEDVPSDKRSFSAMLCEPTPPGSPTRCYGYYTSSSPKSCRNSSFSPKFNTNRSPSASVKVEKVAYFPAESPKSIRNKFDSSRSLTPSGSPHRSPRSSVTKDEQHSSVHDEEMPQNTILKSPMKHSSIGRCSTDIRKSILNRIKFRHRAKSLELSSPPSSNLNEDLTCSSVPDSPSKLNKNSRTTKFCQAITKFFPHLSGSTCKSEKHLPDHYDKIVVKSLEESSEAVLKELTNMDDNNREIVFYKISNDIEELVNKTNGYPEVKNISEKYHTHYDPVQESCSEERTINAIVNPIHYVEKDKKNVNLSFDKEQFPSEYSAIMKDDMLYVEAPANSITIKNKLTIKKNTEEILRGPNLENNCDKRNVFEKGNKKELFSPDSDDPQFWDEVSLFSKTYVTKTTESKCLSNVMNDLTLNSDRHLNVNAPINGMESLNNSKVLKSKDGLCSNASTLKQEIGTKPTRPHQSTPPPLPPRQISSLNNEKAISPPPIPPRKLKPLKSSQLSQKR